MEAWRLVDVRYAGEAFSGEGAARCGGRWNQTGSRVVYASGTLSLAALEMLVHLPVQSRQQFVAIRIEFAPALLESLASSALPRGWADEPPTRLSQQIGEAWLRERRSLMLAVPSALVPTELNYLINPLHADFRKLKFGNPQPFSFDPRLRPSSRTS